MAPMLSLCFLHNAIINKLYLEKHLSRGMIALERASTVSKQTIVKQLREKQELTFAEGVELHDGTFKSLYLPCLLFLSCYSNQKIHPYS